MAVKGDFGREQRHTKKDNTSHEDASWLEADCFIERQTYPGSGDFA